MEMNLAMFERQFKIFDVNTVQKALDDMVSSRVQIYGFGDLIGALKERIADTLPKVDVGKAWEQVLRSASCDYQRAREHYEKLPCDVQKAIGSVGFLVELGWSNQDSVQFLRKDFEKKMEIVLEREKSDFLSGLKTYEQIEADTQKPSLEAKENGMSSITDIMKGLTYGNHN